MFLDKFSVSDDLKNKMVKGAVVGAALGLIAFKRRPKAEEFEFEIKDLDEAKRVIGEVKDTTEYITRQYLNGEIEEEELTEKIDNAIFNISGGVLVDKDDFVLYNEVYEAMLEANIK